MKKIVFVLAIVTSIIACKSNDQKVGGTPLTLEQKEKAKTDTANFTTLLWLDSISTDLGKLQKDKSIEITYRFKNSGTKNLVIESVSAQCGCTIPEKPEQAFAPGEEGVIKAKFNGSGQGAIRKEIYVRANTRPEMDHTLTFRGEIIQ